MQNLQPFQKFFLNLELVVTFLSTAPDEPMTILRDCFVCFCSVDFYPSNTIKMCPILTFKWGFLNHQTPKTTFLQ